MKHPKTGTGQMSKFLPKEVAKHVHAAYTDPQLLSMRQDVALITARQFELMKRLDTGESGAGWKELAAHWNAMQAAQRNAIEAKQQMQSAGLDEAAFNRANRVLQAANQEVMQNLQAMGAIISANNKRDDAWKELESLTHRLSGLKRAEMSRLETLHNCMMAEEVILLVTMLQKANLEMIEQFVRSPEDAEKARAFLAVRFGELVNFKGDIGQGMQVLESAGNALQPPQLPE